MNTTASATNSHWLSVCKSEDLLPNLGIRALIEDQQVAIYRVQDNLYGLSAIDPFSQAAVLSRGIVGDLKGHLVVASPIYKQHFILATGVCLEDENVSVKTYQVREYQGKIQVLVD
jgi:nitrite reductase (NADH) small subunit